MLVCESKVKMKVNCLEIPHVNLRDGQICSFSAGFQLSGGGYKNLRKTAFPTTCQPRDLSIFFYLQSTPSHAHEMVPYFFSLSIFQPRRVWYMLVLDGCAALFLQFHFQLFKMEATDCTPRLTIWLTCFNGEVFRVENKWAPLYPSHLLKFLIFCCSSVRFCTTNVSNKYNQSKHTAQGTKQLVGS